MSTGIGTPVFYHTRRLTQDGETIPAVVPAIITLIHTKTNEIVKEDDVFFASITAFNPSGVSHHDCQRAPHPGYDHEGYACPQTFHFGMWSDRMPVLP